MTKNYEIILELENQDNEFIQLIVDGDGDCYLMNHESKTFQLIWDYLVFNVAQNLIDNATNIYFIDEKLQKELESED